MSFSINRTNNKIVKKTVSLTSNPTINTNVFEETYQIVSSTNSIITLPSNSNNNSNYYNNWYIKILSGNGINQIRQIQSYNSINKQLTLKTTLEIIPSSNDSIILYNKLNSNIIWQESNNRFAPVFMKNSSNLNQMGETVDYLDFGCNNLTILSNKQSHSTSSGSLIVNGGAGITGTVNIGNSLNVTNSISCNNLSVNGISITGNLSNVYLTDIAPGTASISKALVLNSSGNISGINSLTSTNLLTTNFTLNGTLLTASATELNKLTGTTAVTADFNKLASVTSTVAEINYLSGLTLGTISASKSITVDSSSNINSILRLKKIANNQQIYFENGTSTGSIYHYLNGTIVFGSISSNELSFQTNNIIRLTITSSGLMNILGGWQISGTTVTTSAAEINKLTGTTAVTSDFNKLASVTASATEINKLTGTTAVTSDFNKLASITASATELNYLSGLTLGTITASKSITVDSSSNINSILRLKKTVSGQQIYLENGTSTGTIYHDLNGSIYLGTISANNLIFQTQNTNRVTITSAGLMNILGGWQISGTTVTTSAAEINYLDFSTGSPGTAEANKALILNTDRDISNIRKITLNGTEDVLTLSNSTTSARINLRFINDTKSWELGSRGSTTSNPNSFYLYDNQTSSYRLIVDSDGDVNIVNHNGSTTGLQLNGTLVTATAAELNYLDITTEGTAQASKALVLDSNKDIISIRRISTTNISLNNATTYPTVLHCGSTTADRIIGVFNNTTSFYGFGAADNLLKIQSGQSNGIAFYTNATNSSIGTQQMIISSTSTSILQTTSSTNSTSGALIVSGGIGCTGSLNIASNINCSGSLTVGTVGSGPNRINFSGTTGDANNNHTVLAERIYSGTESSELLIFKGNDIPGGSGPDRIRLRAAEIRFQTYTTAEDYSSPVGDNNNRLIITNDGNIAFNGSQETSVLPAAYNTYTYRPSSGGTSLSLGFISASNKASYILQSDLGHHIFMGTNSGTYNTTLYINSLGTSGTSNAGNGICIETNKPANSSWTTLFRATNTTHSISTDLQVNDSAMAFGTYTSNTFSLMTNNANRLNISSSGNIGIGTSSPGYPLHVTGGGSFSGTFIFYARSGSNSNIGVATGNSDTSIYASGRITAGEFNAFSDNRIKKNITDINDISALNTLRLIQPKQYNYIDTLNKTSNPVFGFIAQQVSEVLDYSVNIITDYIPNIFQTAIISLSENNDIILSFNNSINYDSNGTGKVKLITENDNIIYVTIKNKINNYSFSINETLENIEYFIYGEEVNNYHALNKDSIFTITTAAVQEIDRIVIEQKNKITNLENENQQLKDQIQNILIRLQNLENN